MSAHALPTQPGPVQRALDLTASITIGVAATALLGLVVVQGWQVFARYVINDSPSWTEPVTLLLLAAAMSLGAAAGVHSNRHFGFYLLHNVLKPDMRRLIDALVALVIASLGAVISYWSVILLLDGWDIKAAGVNLPQSINYLPLAIGGALMVLFSLNRMLLSLSAARPEGSP